MADHGQDEEMPHSHRRRPDRPPRPPPPVIATTGGMQRSRSESPLRSERRSLPTSEQGRTIQFLIPDVMPESQDFWPRKKKKEKPNETNTEEDAIEPEVSDMQREPGLPTYLGEEPNETDTDPKPKTNTKTVPVVSRLTNIIFRKKSAPENQDDPSPDIGSLRQSSVQARISREPSKKVKRFLYTTDEEVRDALVEFGVFIVFLILTSLVTLSVRHPYMFYFNDTISRLFTTRDMVVAPTVTVCFEKLITVSDWWDYLYFNYFVILHGDMTLSSEEDKPTTEDPTTANPTTAESTTAESTTAESTTAESTTGESTTEGPTEAEGRKRYRQPDGKYIRSFRNVNKTHLEGRVFLHENLMLGPPRIRQIRVKRDSCFVNDAFIRYFSSCYADYSQSVEEVKKEHGGAPYRTMSELQATPLWTTLNFYRSGGYTFDMTYDKTENLEKVKSLRENNWLDRGSRLCVLEFNLYNENTDLFQSVKLIAEIPPTGGVIPQSQLLCVKQHSFLTDNSMTNTVIYIFWYVMVVYYNINEVNALRRSGLKNYFKVTINILDAIILLFCYLALIYNIWHTYKVSTVLSHVQRYETYHSLDTLCFWNIIYVDMMAILAFLVWIKIFKFISFNKTLVQFTTTLRRCSKDLAGFSLMFGIVFIAYAQLGLLLFGTKHPDFRNFMTSILTMIRMILGDFQYNLIEQANRVLGPIYFLTYILLVFFILLNMFLAIIMETYNTVKSEITQGRSQLGNYIYKKLSNLFYFIIHCGTKQRVEISKQRESEEFQNDPTASNRYDQKKTELHKNLTPNEAQYFEDVPDEVRSKDIYRLNNRISLLEDLLEHLVKNMDSILKRVENELRKSKKE